MLKTKKGFVSVVAWIFSLLIASPMVLLGIGIFLLVLLLGIYFALGKIIGVVIVAAGLFFSFKINWKVGLVFVAIGALLFFNPFSWDSLSMVPLSQYGGWLP